MGLGAWGWGLGSSGSGSRGPGVPGSRSSCRTAAAWAGWRSVPGSCRRAGGDRAGGAVEASRTVRVCGSPHAPQACTARVGHAGGVALRRRGAVGPSPGVRSFESCGLFGRSGPSRRRGGAVGLGRRGRRVGAAGPSGWGRMPVTASCP
ncbi:hypothetical protein C3492_03185 [Streptomyces sp. Ru62]|nr:hypothetical protein C3492_03185 [Streptomyces sp. Ru62]